MSETYPEGAAACQLQFRFSYLDTIPMEVSSLIGSDSLYSFVSLSNFWGSDLLCDLTFFLWI